MQKEDSKAEGELELTERQHRKKYLFWGAFLMFIAILLLFYSINPELVLINSQTWLELLLHLSMALFIAGILIITVEIITRRFHLRRSEILTKKISEDILATIFEQLTPKEIRDEVIDYIFKSDFYYKDYEAEATAEEVTINNQALLKVSCVTRVEVHNPTNEGKRYVTPSFLYDIDTVKDLPEPIINDLLIKDEKDNELYTFQDDRKTEGASTH